MTWTPRDKELMARMMPARSMPGAVAALSRPEREIEKHWRRLKIPQRPWTPDEREELRRLVTRLDVKKTAERLGRSPEEIVAEAERLGILTPQEAPADYNRWTTTERASVTQMLKNRTSYKHICSLSGRSIESIKSFAARCGLTRPAAPKWNPDEDQILRKWYGRETSEMTAKRLNRSPDATRARARLLGLTDKK